MRFRDYVSIAALFLAVAALSVAIVAGADWVAGRYFDASMLPDWMDHVGAVFSGLALVALIYSLSLQNVIVKSEINTSVGARQIDVDRVLIEYPHLRPFFLEGRNLQSDEEHYQQVAAAAVLFANFFDTYLLDRGDAEQLYGDAEWNAYVTDHLRGSPVMRRVISERKAWFSQALVDASRTIDPELDTSHPTG